LEKDRYFGSPPKKNKNKQVEAFAKIEAINNPCIPCFKATKNIKLKTISVIVFKMPAVAYSFFFPIPLITCNKKGRVQEKNKSIKNSLINKNFVKREIIKKMIEKIKNEINKYINALEIVLALSLAPVV